MCPPLFRIWLVGLCFTDADIQSRPWRVYHRWRRRVALMCLSSHVILFYSYIGFLLPLFFLKFSTTSDHGLKSRSRPLTQRVLRRIGRSGSNRSRVICTKRFIESSKNSERQIFKNNVNINIQVSHVQTIT